MTVFSTGRWVGVCSVVLASVVALLGGMAGCGGGEARGTGATVVVYTSVDQPVSEPILEKFHKKTGIKVELKTDAEATRTAGLAERLRAEKGNPKADVWWGNEVFHTIRLAEEGVLTGYESASSADIPPVFRDLGNRWASVGLRARVIAVSPGSPFVPRTLEALADPRLKGKIAMARPTAGTTGGHVAALYVVWGREKADAYFRALRANGIVLLGGNSVVAEEVGRGNFYAGLTDNDDVQAAQREGGKLELVLPDQEGAGGTAGMGTLTMPTTVGQVGGGPHPKEARELIDYLLSSEVEQELIKSGYAGYSVRTGTGNSLKPMTVDYAKVAEGMPEAVRRATGILEGRE